MTAPTTATGSPPHSFKKFKKTVLPFMPRYTVWVFPLLLTLFLFLNAPWERLAALVLQKANLPLSYGSLQLNGTTLTLHHVQLHTHPRAENPPLFAEKITVSPAWLSLLKLAPAMRIKAHAYEGTAHVDVGYSPFSSALTLTGQTQNMALHGLPLGEGFILNQHIQNLSGLLTTRFEATFADLNALESPKNKATLAVMAHRVQGESALLGPLNFQVLNGSIQLSNGRLDADVHTPETQSGMALDMTFLATLTPALLASPAEAKLHISTDGSAPMTLHMGGTLGRFKVLTQ